MTGWDDITAALDQQAATWRDSAIVFVAYYKALVAGGLPTPLAEKITLDLACAYHARLVGDDSQF